MHGTLSMGPRGPSAIGAVKSHGYSGPLCHGGASVVEPVRARIAHHSRARGLVRSRCAPTDDTATIESSTDAPSENGASGKPTNAVPTILEYKDGGVQSDLATSTKLALAIPWRRVKKGSFLSLRLEGTISEQKQARFSTNASMPALCECLRKAAYDPRISGLFIRVSPLAIGWAKVQELMAHIEFFKKSGKPTVAYMQSGGEKEYALAAACGEIYVPPTAQLALRGLSVQGQFLRGVLDKVGVEPQVKRIGKYKSAGDQLLRKDMSEPQREQLSALLDGLYDYFLSHVAKARGKKEEDVAALLDAGVYDMQKLLEGGWVTGLKYADEVQDDLDARFGNVDRKKKKKQSGMADKDGTPKSEKKLTFVPYSKYKNVSPSAFGLTGKKVIAVLREQGSIVSGTKSQSGQITAEPLIKKLRGLAEDNSIAGVVLRVDSPGGDALASDLMWREIKKLAKEKPLVATMGDVAASGGYYMSMAAPTVLAHPLTITGSIGVVTGKFNLAELYDRVGFSKTVLSRGKYAELLSDNRGFTEAEEALFDEAADFAYRSFRDKAAESRGMAPEELEEHAQGRVWLGNDALGNGLVDHMGGIDNAVALVKEAAEIPADEQVTMKELSVEKPSLQQAIASGGLSSRKDVLRLLLTDPGFVVGTLGFAVVPLLMQFLPMIPQQTSVEMNGAPQLTLDSLFVQIADGSTGQALRSALFPRALMPDIKLGSSSPADTNSVLDNLNELP